MKLWQKRVWNQVWARDGGHCQDCGTYCATIHHVVPLGSGWDERLLWVPKNMLALCEGCHLPEPGRVGAHNQKARYRHLTLLAQRFDYDYQAEPWATVMRRGEE